MSNRFILIFLIALCPVMLTDCAASRQANQLASHLEKLTKAANGNVDPELKMDILATSFVAMMHESLGILNPKKGVSYVQKYGSQNKAPIEKILADVGEWQRDLTLVDKIALGIRVVQKPYVRELIELGPKFKAKYEQVKFVMDMTGKLKKGLIGLGAKQLNF